MLDKKRFQWGTLKTLNHCENLVKHSNERKQNVKNTIINSIDKIFQMRTATK